MPGQDAKAARSAGDAPLSGQVAAGFEPVREAFAELLRTGAETGGAVAVYRHGAPVVDLYGGWSDTARSRPWTADTVVMVYSVTKAFAAVATLQLVDRGLLDLDDPVASVWPEFAAAGKEQVTLRQVLAHQAGLPSWAEPMPPTAFADWARLADALARAEPEWEPGSRHAEHALTYGHLLGEVVRRVTNSSLGSLLRTELCEPHDLDFAIGLTTAGQQRAAELEYGAQDWPSTAAGPAGSLWARALGNPAGALDLEVVNSASWRAAEVPAVNGHGTARAVARFYGLLLDGGLLSAELRAELCRPQLIAVDQLLGREVGWGLGVQVDEAEFGMGGVGGSSGFASRRYGYSFGYVTRRLADHARADALAAAVEGCLSAANPAE